MEGEKQRGVEKDNGLIKVSYVLVTDLLAD
jgi:hypothetical protein